MVGDAHVVETCNLADSEDEDDISAHSAISNASDLDDDEGVDYLSLEIVHHLPADVFAKFMKTLRAKEKSMQDLLERNRVVLETCTPINEEPATSEVEVPPTPQPTGKEPTEHPVDSSIFAQLERGKEEQILRLRDDNKGLLMHTQRLDEQNKQLREALVQAKREFRRMQHRGLCSEVKQQHVTGNSAVDEEERLYREMQRECSYDRVLSKLQQEQAANRTKIQHAFRRLLDEDVRGIQQWESDAHALLIAVDGAERRLKQAPKAPKKTKTAKIVGDTVSTDLLDETSMQLLDDFDAMKFQLETIDRMQLTLEQTVHGVHDGAKVVAVELDRSASTLDQEVEAIREQNTTWVGRLQALSLEDCIKVLGELEEASANIIKNAPPGLVAPHLEDHVRRSGEQVTAVSAQLSDLSRTLCDLREDGIIFGRRVKAFHQAHRRQSACRQREVSEELQRSTKALEEPLEHLRSCLRQQADVIGRARTRVRGSLEDLSAAVRRACMVEPVDEGNRESSVWETRNSEPIGEMVLAELHEVRNMGKALVTSLKDGERIFTRHLEQALAAFTEGSPQFPRTTSTHTGEGEDNITESKKKKGRRKKGSSITPMKRTKNCTAVQEGPSEGAGNADPAPAELDEESVARADLLEAFSEEAYSSTKAKLEGQPEPQGDQSVAPNDVNELFRTMEDLRGEQDALVAKVAARLQLRGAACNEVEPAAKSSTQRRRKKTFA